MIPVRSPADRAVLAERLVAEGRTAEAVFEIERLALDSFALIPRDRDWLASMVRIASACRKLDRSDVAAEVRLQLRPFWDRTVVAGRMPCLFFGAVAYYTKVLAATLAEPDAARVDLAAAAEIHEELSARLWLNSTRCEQARVSLARGEPGDDRTARQLLAQAEEEAAGLGLVQIRELTNRLLGRPPEAVATGPRFRRQDDGWSVAFRSPPVHVPDSTGTRGRGI